MIQKVKRKLSDIKQDRKDRRELDKQLDNLTDDGFFDRATGISDVKKLVSIAGRVERRGIETIIIFKVFGKLYPSTDHNNDVVDAYMHSGDAKFLDQLEGEIEG